MVPWFGTSPLLIAYPIFAVFMLVVVLAAVPRRCIRRLFFVSLIFGFFASLLLVVSCTALDIFRYQYYGPFSMAGSPIFLNIAWSPAILIYLHFQPPMTQKYHYGIYLLIWALLSSMLDLVFHKMGLLLYIHWSPYHRFFAALLLFLATSWYHRRLGQTGWPVEGEC